MLSIAFAALGAAFMLLALAAWREERQKSQRGPIRRFLTVAQFVVGVCDLGWAIAGGYDALRVPAWLSAMLLISGIGMATFALLWLARPPARIG
jgi:hypothetical protein